MVERKILWDRRGVIQARDISKFAKSPRDKHGAVVYDDRHVPVGHGYDGIPSDLRDLPERMANAELRQLLQLSAVDWALHFAGERAVGGTIYTWPVAPSVRDAILIIRARCARVVYTVHSVYEELPNLTARGLLEEADIECVETGAIGGF